MTVLDPAPAAPSTGAAPGQEWWRRAVVYQVYPRSFADADGDGVGDLRGVIDHLDHIAALGADVVWLSPFYPSPQVDNGYDISDHCAVDPLFGTLQDVDDLLARAHRLGLRVIIDIVPNHTSDAHPWFRDALTGPAAAHRDWYVWRPPRPGHVGGRPGAEPNNWESFFSGPAWTVDEASGEYYLHLFAREQPDLNWENPAVRAAMADVLRFWIARGVDGFRFDVLDLLSKVPGLPDGAPLPGRDLGDGVPYYTCGPRIHEFVAELTAVIRTETPAVLLTVGEMPGVTIEQGLAFTDPAHREVDMVFAFDHVDLGKGDDKFDVRPVPLPVLKDVFRRWQEGLGDRGWNSLYWSNHDQPRVVSRFGDDGEHRVASATALATVLHLHRGTPYVYQGEELGMTNTALRTPDDLVDIESRQHVARALAAGRDLEDVMAGVRAVGRDNARTPMQWTGGPAAGFTTGTPWMPVAPNHREINVVVQRDDPDSVLNHYRRLIALRHEDAVVTDGAFALLLPEHPSLWAFTRTTATEELLVLAHCAAGELPVAELVEQACGGAGWARAELVLANHRPGAPLAPLGSWHARVLRRRISATR